VYGILWIDPLGDCGLSRLKLHVKSRMEIWADGPIYYRKNARTSSSVFPDEMNLIKIKNYLKRWLTKSNFLKQKN
jgi:hypothetical protein